MSSIEYAAVQCWEDLATLLARSERPPDFLKHASSYRVNGRSVRLPVSLRRYPPHVRSRLVKPFAIVMTLSGASLHPSLSTWAYDVWGVWKHVRRAARICHSMSTTFDHASDVVVAELNDHERMARQLR